MCVINILSFAVSLASLVAVLFFNFATRKMEKATAEYHIFCTLHDDDKELADLYVKIKTTDIDVITLSNVVLERRKIFLDGLTYACGLYLDKKVDRKRFEKEYATYIRKKAKEPENAKLLQKNADSYQNILEVLKLWEASKKDGSK